MLPQVADQENEDGEEEQLPPKLALNEWYKSYIKSYKIVLGLYGMVTENR